MSQKSVIFFSLVYNRKICNVHLINLFLLLFFSIKNERKIEKENKKKKKTK